MARTYKDQPYQIRRAKANKKKPPKNWREITHWRLSNQYYRNLYEDWDEIDWWGRWQIREIHEAETFGNHDLWWHHWMRMESPPKWFRQQLNQNYRAKVKMRIKMEDYDNIDRPRRNANWLWW